MEDQIIFNVKANGTLEAIKAVEAIQKHYLNAKISVEVVVANRCSFMTREERNPTVMERTDTAVTEREVNPYLPKSKAEERLNYAASIKSVKAAMRAVSTGRSGKNIQSFDFRKNEANGTDQKAEAMRRAIAITFERALKSDLYLQAAQRGQDHFFYLLDLNTPMIAESVLGMYQRILNEIVDVDARFQ